MKKNVGISISKCLKSAAKNRCANQTARAILSAPTVFATGKSGMRRNISFCLNLFWYQIGTFIFAPGRKWNKKERFF